MTAMRDPDFLSRAWPDMCAAYRAPELAQACLALQDAFAVDVPLLLLLCLADRAGHGIADNGLTVLIASAGSWRETVIVPLRQARRGMKHRFLAKPETTLRDEIKRLELEAERLHVERLAADFPPAATAGQGAALRYLAHCGVTDEAAADFVALFAAVPLSTLDQRSPAGTA